MFRYSDLEVSRYFLKFDYILIILSLKESQTRKMSWCFWNFKFYFFSGFPCGFSSRLCSSFLDASILSPSAASTIYTIAFTPLQYLSHIDRNLGCPPELREFFSKNQCRLGSKTGWIQVIVNNEHWTFWCSDFLKICILRAKFFLAGFGWQLIKKAKILWIQQKDY